MNFHFEPVVKIQDNCYYQVVMESSHDKKMAGKDIWN